MGFALLVGHLDHFAWVSSGSLLIMELLGVLL
jgi:hypothetical protein